MLKQSNSFKILRAPRPLRPASTSTAKSILSQMAYDDDYSNVSSFGDAIEKNSNYGSSSKGNNHMSSYDQKPKQPKLSKFAPVRRMSIMSMESEDSSTMEATLTAEIAFIDYCPQSQLESVMKAEEELKSIFSGSSCSTLTRSFGSIEYSADF